MDDVQPDTAPGDVRDGAGHREAGQEQELQQVAGGEGGYLLRRAQSAGDGRSGNAVDVDAHTVVLHLDDHSPARVVRAQGEDPAGGLTRADGVSGSSMPWPTALRTRCISGSLTASSKARSSAVSPPTTSRWTWVPQAAARSRTTRGILAQR